MRYFVEEFRLDAAMVSEAGAFLVVEGPKHIFSKRRPSDLVCRTSDYGRSLLPKARK